MVNFVKGYALLNHGEKYPVISIKYAAF